MPDESFDFVVTSPPYWSILNKEADYKVKKERLAHGLATNYAENDKNDLANIKNYQDFINTLVSDIFLECGRVLKTKNTCVSSFVIFATNLSSSVSIAI